MHKKTERIVFPVGLTAFAFSFIVQLFFNRYVTTIRSLPDEMGAIYLAAKCVGYDWSYVMIHSERYYGSLMCPFLLPFFVFVKNPYKLYQCLLGVGSLFRCLPALYVSSLMKKQYRICDSFAIFLTSVVCVFATPTKAVNIDNEPILIFLCWTVFYILVRLQYVNRYPEDRNASGRWSAALAIVLSLSLLAHTRALIYTITVVFVLILFRIFSGKNLVNTKLFILTCAIAFPVSAIIVRIWKHLLYEASAGTYLANTSGTLAEGLARGIKKTTGNFGVQSLLDLLAGNIFVIFVFSGGMIIAGLIYFFLLFFRKAGLFLHGKQHIEETSLMYPLMYASMGILIILAGLCLTWLKAAIRVHTESADVSRGHFYLRYYGMYFGPMVFGFILALIRERDVIVRRKGWRKVFLPTLLLGVFSCAFSLISFLPASIAGNKRSDWFYNFAPLSFSFRDYPTEIQNAAYYIRSFLIASVIFVILLILLSKKQRRMWGLVFLCLLLYEYSYCVIKWDYPITGGVNFYESSDGMYQLRCKHEKLFKDVDQLHQFGDGVSRYCVQFALPDIKVVNEVPDEESEKEALILISSMEKLREIKPDCTTYKMVEIDEGEILLIKGKELQERFANEGMALQDISEIVDED